MKMRKVLIPVFILLLIPVLATCDTSDFMRSTGKINVVFAVIFIVFIGIIFFLFRLENKIKKIENRITNE